MGIRINHGKAAPLEPANQELSTDPDFDAACLATVLKHGRSEGTNPADGSLSSFATIEQQVAAAPEAETPSAPIAPIQAGREHEAQNTADPDPFGEVETREENRGHRAGRRRIVADQESAAVLEHRAEVERLSSRLTEFKATIEQQETLLAEHNAETERHRALVAKYQTTIEQNASTLAERDAEVERLSSRLTERKATIEQQETLLAEHKAAIDRHTATIANNQTTIEQNASTLAERDTEMERHAATIADYQATIEQNASTLRERDAQVERHAAQVAEYQATIEQSASTLAEREAEVSLAREDVSEQKQHVAALNQKLIATNNDADNLRSALSSRQTDFDTNAATLLASLKETESQLELEVAELGAASQREAAALHEIGSLRGSISDLRAKHEAELIEFRADHDSQIIELQDSISRREADAQETVDTIRRSLNNTELQRKSNATELITAGQREAEIEKEAFDLRSEVVELRTLLTRRDIEADALNQALDTRESEWAELRETMVNRDIEAMRQAEHLRKALLHSEAQREADATSLLAMMGQRQADEEAVRAPEGSRWQVSDY